MPLTISMSVAQLLKRETFEEHAKAEKLLAPKLASIQSYNDYAAILKMFYGFFCPLEKRIERHLSQEILVDVHERRNSLFILRDLESIQSSTEDLLLCKTLPGINSSLQALGTMYVLEGSTLGGRMIGKMLMKNPGVTFNDANLNFFNGYKENTGTKWTYFLSVVDQYEDHADVMIASANETFRCLTKWMEECL